MRLILSVPYACWGGTNITPHGLRSPPVQEILTLVLPLGCYNRGCRWAQTSERCTVRCTGSCARPCHGRTLFVTGMRMPPGLFLSHNCINLAGSYIVHQDLDLTNFIPRTLSVQDGVWNTLSTAH